MNCLDCEAKLLETTLSSYHMTESGLDSVFLLNWPGFKCTNCGGQGIPLLPDAEKLGTYISKKLLNKKRRLSGEEIRFMRESVGLRTEQLAWFVKMSAVDLIRTENGQSSLTSEQEMTLRKTIVIFLFSRQLIAKAELSIANTQVNASLSPEPLRIEINGPGYLS